MEKLLSRQFIFKKFNELFGIIILLVLTMLIVSCSKLPSGTYVTIDPETGRALVFEFVPDTKAFRFSVGNEDGESYSEWGTFSVFGSSLNLEFLDGSNGKFKIKNSNTLFDEMNDMYFIKTTDSALGF